MKLIAGLGNPGSKYVGTRHNVGFEVVQGLAGRFRSAEWKLKFEGSLAEVECRGEKVLLLMPQTFMNLSGRSVSEAVRFYKLFPTEVLVICDDMNLPLGKIRLKGSGSAGGQKGLQNILERLGTEDVPRLRMGIGRPPGQQDPATYVLQQFRTEEQEEVSQMVSTAVDAAECWLTQGMLTAMNRYNGSVS